MAIESTSPTHMETSPPNPAPRRSKAGWLFWVELLAVLVVVQWPMLKGAFYRATGAPPPEDQIAWRTDYEAALLESRQTGKPVMIDFTADWCPPCQVMKHDVWPDDSVRRTLEEQTIP